MGLLAAQQTQGRVHRTQDSVWVGVRGQGCLEPGVPDSELWAPWLPRLRALPGSRPGTCSGLCSALGRCLPAAPSSRGGAGLEVKVGWGGGAGLASAPVWSDPEASTLSSPGDLRLPSCGSPPHFTWAWHPLGRGHGSHHSSGGPGGQNGAGLALAFPLQALCPLSPRHRHRGEGCGEPFPAAHTVATQTLTPLSGG